METTYTQIRHELIRSIRGKYSQERTSKKMGFKSNPIHKWETSDADVGWDQFVNLCKVCNRNIQKAVSYILGFSGDALDSRALIQHLVGCKSISEIAKKTGYSRFIISKWLSGKAHPSLDIMLRLLNEFQFILIEFVETLTAIENVPSLIPISEKLKAQKQAVYENPELEAILCCLTIDKYQKLHHHDDTMIANTLQISPQNVALGLKKLLEVGLVEERGRKFFAKITQIDTQGSFHGAIHIRKYWAKKYLNFLDQMQPPEGKNKTAYFIMDLSEEAELEVLEAYHEFCFKLRAIAQRDYEPKKLVKFCAAQIIDFGSQK